MKFLIIFISFFIINQQISAQNCNELNEQTGKLYKIGKLSEAIKTARTAVNKCFVELGKENAAYILSVENLGYLDQSSGNYSEAETFFKQVLQLREKTLGKNHHDYIKALNNMAILYTAMNNYAAAEPLYKESLLIYEKILGTNTSEYAGLLNDLAYLYENIGNYAAAEPLLKQALEIEEKVSGKISEGYSVDIGNLGLLYESMHDYKKAGPLLKQALEIDEKTIGKEDLDYASDLNNLAVLYAKMKRFNEAEKLYRQALQIDEKMLGKQNPDYATDLNNLAEMYQNMGNYVAAEPLVKQALLIREKVLGKQSNDYAESLMSMGILLCRENQPLQSVGYFKDAAKISQDFIKQGTTYLSEKELQLFIKNNNAYFQIYKSVALQTKNNALIESSLNNVLLLKGLGLQNVLQLENSINTSLDTVLKNKYEQFLLLKKSVTAEDQKPVDKRINKTQLETEANNVEKELMQLSPGFQKQVNTNSVTWQEVQRTLKPNEAAIEFVDFNYWDKSWRDTTWYVAYIIRNTGEPKMIRLCEKKQLQKRINDSMEKDLVYVNQLYKQPDRGIPINGNKKDTIPSLYELLWQPIDSALKDISTIYFSPDGLIHRINISAIQYGGKKVLADKYTLHLLPCTRDKVLYQSTDVSQSKMLLYGGIRYEMDSTQIAHANDEYKIINKDNNATAMRSGIVWEYLEGTDEEKNQIEQLAKSNNIDCIALSGYNATEESFKYYTSQNPSPGIIHLSTHGFFFPDNVQQSNAEQSPFFVASKNPLLRSGLVMAGANNINSSATEDGILTAAEISNTLLAQTKLVVLSACETGLGKIENNEGVYGLQRAFKIDGVNNLIMSLWKVDDNATQKFMDQFYTFLLRDKLNVYDAFLKAQTQMKDIYTQPYYWAGFVLME